jgi:FeS assembly protein IscX
MLVWTDTLEIAIELHDAYPDQDPSHINFIELRDKVLALPEFRGEPRHCGERVLEAIQQAWIDERR